MKTYILIDYTKIKNFVKLTIHKDFLRLKSKIAQNLLTKKEHKFKKLIYKLVYTIKFYEIQCIAKHKLF